MSELENQHEENASALEAMAGGQDSPAETPETGSTSGLMLLEQGRQPDQAAADFLREQAEAAQQASYVPDNPIVDNADAAPDLGGSGDVETDEAADTETGAEAEGEAEAAGTPTDALGDLAAAAAPRGQALDEMAAVSAVAIPEIRPGRATRLNVSSNRAQAHAYKKTMIPLLAVVGVLLLGFSLFTLMALMGDPGDRTALAPTGSSMRAYGKYFILAALPLGAALLLGAWLFHVDVKNTEAREAREAEARS